MNLSSRAQAFLSRRERRAYIGDRDRIIAALEEADLPVFEAVVTFQQNYGGYTFYAALAPLVYGILHPEPCSTEPYRVSGMEDEGVWYFQCVDTLYQMEFHIDQSGRYFEELEPMFSSMDMFIEHQALSHELAREGNWQPVQVELPVSKNARANYLSELGLRAVAETSDEFTSWWVGHELCVHLRGSDVKAWGRMSEGNPIP